MVENVMVQANGYHSPSVDFVLPGVGCARVKVQRYTLYNGPGCDRKSREAGCCYGLHTERKKKETGLEALEKAESGCWRKELSSTQRGRRSACPRCQGRKIKG